MNNKEDERIAKAILVALVIIIVFLALNVLIYFLTGGYYLGKQEAKGRPILITITTTTII